MSGAECCMEYSRNLMVQGTGSHVGKSILVAALCRIFRQDGHVVSPFKSQNMALNSYVTIDGGEMGRAQVVQAQAAGLEPHTDMNPVLLKPAADNASQVIVQGHPVGTYSARYYHNDYVKMVWPAILESFDRLQREYQIIVLEGAGSPAEVNLRKNDVVNMRAAHMADAPVLLVADIDKGGALAAVVGTLELLPPDDRRMVAGIIINKFRGDRELLQPALDFLEARTCVPILGVIPYCHFNLPEEDTINDELISGCRSEERIIDIGVLYLPHISNFTDFDPLAAEPDVILKYIKPGENIGSIDCLIIPGSKNTIGDLKSIRGRGWDRQIINVAEAGVPIIGVCGGLQMLGRLIRDPNGIESPEKEVLGLGLLDIETEFCAEKTTWQVKGEVLSGGISIDNDYNREVIGYEIHMGHSFRGSGASPAFRLRRQNQPNAEVLDGAVNHTGLVWGTYLHGLFDSDGFRRAFLNQLRKRKGLTPMGNQYNYCDSREAAFDRLAQVVRENIDLQRIYQLIGL